MSDAEIRKLWLEVVANSKQLEACEGPRELYGVESEFQGAAKDGGRMYRRYECLKCRGKISSHDKLWYERGLKHGAIK